MMARARLRSVLVIRLIVGVHACWAIWRREIGASVNAQVIS
jgi:hypothetical protein